MVGGGTGGEKLVNNTMKKVPKLEPLQATGDPVQFHALFVEDGQKVIFFLVSERKLTADLLEVLRDLLKVLGIGNKSPG